MNPAADPAVRRATPASSATRSLRRLRLRLTAWYVGTFAVVLVALGALLFAGLAHGVSADLESSLREATLDVANAANNGEADGRSPGSGSIEAVRKLQLPGRKLYLFDLEGNSLVPGTADSTLRELARNAAANSFATNRWEATDDQTLQAYAERFVTRGGKTFVAAAVVDRDLTDDRYSTLVALVGGLGALGLILVAAGGWILARQSIVPVEHSMEQMRRFIADAAHELRTPVAVIRSRVDVTLEKPREAAAYEHALTELRGEVERLSLLINDLFMLARADAGERAVVSARVQLDEIALESVATAGWIAARRGVTLHVEEADEAVIEGDPTLLRQLALIVLDNAIKFSECGGSVVIAVRVAAEGATFSVVDDGVGIAEADVGRVFDRFYRAESVRGTTQGAGLGLAIARWIADAHGAQIVLEPAAVRGTRVAVTFPVQTRAEHPRST